MADLSVSPVDKKKEPLIYYGPIWDERLELAREAGKGPVAVLVCHGMGQQVRYETISSLAEALLREVREKGADPQDVKVRLSEANDDFLARAEVMWTLNGHSHEVHVYEAYWAPLTEGEVTYWETIKFLFRAGFYGLWHSRPFWPSSFQRWVFGGPKPMKIGRLTWIGLILVLLVLLLQVAAIAYVSLTLAAQWKTALSLGLPALGQWKDWFNWLAAFVPKTANGPSATSRLGVTFLWIFLIAESLFIRYFIVEYVGDVAAYISPYKDSKFDELRHQIRQIGLNVGRVIYGFGPDQTTVPHYAHVVVVGHSLGSVLAYDTLNSLINEDQICAKQKQRQVLARTRALITFGSPLDKTAFMFRLQAKDEEQWIREKLAASMQPLIVSDQYRPASFAWTNIWSPMDIISGSLDYYDDPDKPPDFKQRVQNVTDWAAWVPFYAHVQYWHNEKLREELYRRVS
jgi:hypothetical protein